MSTPPSGDATYPSPNASDESQDSGLGLEWVYLNADVGGAYIEHGSRSARATSACSRPSSSGRRLRRRPRACASSSSRLGVRARDLQLSSFNLWELDAEARLPHARLAHRPVLRRARRLRVRRAASARAPCRSPRASTTSDVSVHGCDVGPDVRHRHLLHRASSPSAPTANAEFLFLQRPPPPLPAGSPGRRGHAPRPAAAALQPVRVAASASASSRTAHLGIHF